MNKSKKISVVIPVYNSEKILENTIKRTVKFFENKKINYEIILINDGSPDNTWQIIEKVVKNNHHIKGINLLKNYGQHNAVFCGFSFATGDYVITMDDDLQNPPEEMIHLINEIKKGYDVVFGKFYEKKHHFFRRIGTLIIGYLNEKIFGKPKNITLTNFRIIKKQIIKQIIKHRTISPYIPGLILLFSSSIGNVKVKHESRKIGNSNYNLLRIFKLVNTLLFKYSSFPIRVLTVIGFVIASICFALGMIIIVKKILLDTSVEGWTTLIVLISFLGGFIILMLGVLGEYIMQILNQTTSNKSYIVKKLINV